jgi:hypothetical protein
MSSSLHPSPRNRPLAAMLVASGLVALITLVSAVTGQDQHSDRQPATSRLWPARPDRSSTRNQESRSERLWPAIPDRRGVPQKLHNEVMSGAHLTPPHRANATPPSHITPASHQQDGSPNSPHSHAAPLVYHTQAHANPHQAGPHGEAIAGNEPYLSAMPLPVDGEASYLSQQTEAEAMAKSAGCIACHQGVVDMHNNLDTVRLGCSDCHGGDPCATTKEQAHVRPVYGDVWATSANPVRTYTLLNYESPEFIRFVNPGDLRVAHISCGGCHPREVLHVKKSMMTHGAMLWQAALYNNGAVPTKNALFGESYSMRGAPQRIQTVPPPTPEEMIYKGVVPYLDPLPRFEISQPSNVLRIFERGGRFRPEVGIPERTEEPGRPRTRLSNRGLGTENRTDPVLIGLQKTRLFDPTLNFLGTNDHPGDYRSSGCTSCHVVYANDRSPVHSGPYAKFGNRGLASPHARTVDPMIPKDEPGHPIEHRFARGNAIPTSQCMICHIHPGTTVMNTSIGYMWWDEESDAELMYPREQRDPTSEEAINTQMRNPNESAQRNFLANPEFVANLTDLNNATRHNQFGDFHGHGWAFRAVFKRDRKGNYLDHKGQLLTDVTNEQMRAAVEIVARMREPYRDAANKAAAQVRAEELKLAFERDGLPVHMLDIHIEKGMHCVDCHFTQDNHGNGRLQREVRAAIEIACEDCHGTVSEPASLKKFLGTSGPAAYTSGPEGRNLEAMRTAWGRRRFEREGGKLYQNSMIEENLRWEVVQVADTINPESDHYNVRSHIAKTVRWGQDEQAPGGERLEWGGNPGDNCAHSSQKMSCIACHTSWNASCFGCHLPQKANQKAPNLHFEGDVSRNLTAYNFQTLRDDVYMLAHDGDVTGNKIGPARSSCAIHVSSYNNNRESIYVQQQTISADGMSGISFSTNVPHTVRGSSPIKGHPSHTLSNGETKRCVDCHLSVDNDNNAIMAQLLMQGTNYVNFIGRYCWVAAGEHGFEGVVVTERADPQAVIGSSFHSIAFPDHFSEHVERGRLIEHAHEHPGKDIIENITRPHREPEVLSLQARGEYLYAACGEGGLRVFDIAFIDHKGFSERITTAPVSPVGQRFFVRTRFATAVAAPTTIAPDPTRIQNPANRERPIHPMYAYIFVVDRYEGLILVNAGTLLDGNPLNNYLQRELTFNPDGILCGAKNITIVGTYAYICCDAGLVVVSLEDPKQPHVTAVVGEEVLHKPSAVQVQFRYAFVCDEEGVKVLDVTELAHPRHVTSLELPEAHNIYLARTYAYVAGGKEGLIILDITNPEAPFVDQVFNANGCINDLHDVKLGITYTSEFAYLADGKNGMHIVQLTSPDTPGNMGFSPRPTPALIATRKIPKEGHALAISKGVDRDRAVDESGNQIAVFGRIGAGPLTLEEQQRMYLRNGAVWRVSEDPFDRVLYRYPDFIKQMLDQRFNGQSQFEPRGPK